MAVVKQMRWWALAVGDFVGSSASAGDLAYLQLSGLSGRRRRASDLQREREDRYAQLQGDDPNSSRFGRCGGPQLVGPAVGDVKLEDMSKRLERTGMKLSDVVSSLKCCIAVGLTPGALACSHARSASAGAPTKPDEVATEKPAPSSPAPQPAATAPAPVLLQADSIYFGFDKSDLDRGSEDVLSRVGGVLAASPDLHMRVEGSPPR
jgi:hypothetical protein